MTSLQFCGSCKKFSLKILTLRPALLRRTMVPDPQLKYTHESSSTHEDHVSGAAAQNTGSKSNKNFQNKGYTTWIPRLHASHPSFHHFTLPTDHAQSTEYTQWHGPTQHENDSRNVCTDYQTIFQDKTCYQTLKWGDIV